MTVAKYSFHFQQFFNFELFYPRFAVNMVPYTSVDEYTATITYNLLTEVQDGSQVDALRMALRAEGTTFSPYPDSLF